MSPDEAAIRQLVATWIAATKAGDVDRVLSLMTDDVLFMVPGQKPFGKEVFAAASRQQAGMRIEGKSDIEEIHVAGDWAWCRTSLALTVTTPDRNTLRRSGTTLSIFRRQAGGDWLLHRDANLLAGDMP